MNNWRFQITNSAMCLPEFKYIYGVMDEICNMSTGNTRWEIGLGASRAESTFENIYSGLFLSHPYSVSSCVCFVIYMID